MVAEAMRDTPAPGGAAWRRMREGDVPAVGAIAALVHPAYPEEDAVFAERLRLYPEGCRVLDLGGRMAGYAIGHPWVFGRPPGLNVRLGALPPAPTVLHLHDIAVLPAARGAGAALRLLGEWVELAHAAGLSGLSLVAVGDAATFWTRRGFAAVEGPRLEQTPHGYGADARYMVRGLR